MWRDILYASIHNSTLGAVGTDNGRVNRTYCGSGHISFKVSLMSSIETNTLFQPRPVTSQGSLPAAPQLRRPHRKGLRIDR